MVGSDVLNGPALAGMAKAYVAAINGGAVPAIATAWQSVAEARTPLRQSPNYLIGLDHGLAPRTSPYYQLYLSCCVSDVTTL